MVFVNFYSAFDYYIGFSNKFSKNAHILIVSANFERICFGYIYMTQISS